LSEGYTEALAFSKNQHHHRPHQVVAAPESHGSHALALLLVGKSQPAVSMGCGDE